jgi:hypothetical protein
MKDIFDQALELSEKYPDAKWLEITGADGARRRFEITRGEGKEVNIEIYYASNHHPEPLRR